MVDNFTTSADIEAHHPGIIENLGVGASGTGQELVDEAIASATLLMWQLTGRQYGLNQKTVRPNNDLAVEAVDLGEYPVTSVLTVKVDGVTLPASGYYVRDDRQLLRTNGELWEGGQKLWLPDSQEGTMSVTFMWGVAPPAAVRAGTRRLAAELLKLSSGQNSMLSERVKSVSRAGVNYELVSPEDLITQPNGRTGIYEVDLAISVTNREGNTAMPTILSPDLGNFGFNLGQVREPSISDAEPEQPSGIIVPETVLTTSASSITITGIDHRSVQISIWTRSTTSGSSMIGMLGQFNGDSGSNYEYVQTGASNSSNTYTNRNEVSNSATAVKFGLVPSSSADRFAMVTIKTVWVPGLGPTVYTDAECVSGASTGSETYLTRTTGVWRNVGAVAPSSLTLFLSSGSFVGQTTYLAEILS